LEYNNCLPPLPSSAPVSGAPSPRGRRENPLSLWERVGVRECGVMSNYFELAILLHNIDYFGFNFRDTKLYISTDS